MVKILNFIVIFLILLKLSAKHHKFSYFTSKSFQKKSKFIKLDEIWKNCVADKSMFKPTIKSNRKAYSHYKNIERYVFELESDVIPFRDKYVFRTGVVAKMSFVPKKNKFSGIFQGGDAGIIRFGTNSYVPTYTLHTPYSFGFGLKFFRDSVFSGNVVISTLNHDPPPPKFNIFLFPWTNRFQDIHFMFQRKQDKAFFGQQKYFNPYLSDEGLFDLAKYNQYGKLSEPKLPFLIILRGSKSVKKVYTYDNKELFGQFFRIKSGLKLFNVYSIDDPKNGCEKLIGSIDLKSKFIYSKFADKHLFFKHSYKLYDLLLHPNWIRYVSIVYGKSNKFVMRKEIGKCPFKEI